MIKQTLILATIISLTATTVFAGEIKTTKTTQQQKQPLKCEKCQKMPPRDFHRGKAEIFEQRLKLTDKQKEQVKKNREKDRAKLDPIMKQIHEKEHAKREIFRKYEQTDPELIKLNKEIKVLKEKRHKIMEENRKSFESMLTKEQKAELEKIKAEHKEKFKNGEGLPRRMPPHPEKRAF